MALILACAAVASSMLGGCCCTTDRVIVRSPGVEVTVVDEGSGEAVQDARVRLCRIRIGPPPDEVLDEWTKTTGPDGRASFEYRRDEETVMPLMIHGVPQRAWELCVEADGHAPMSDEILVETAGDSANTPSHLPDQTVELAESDGVSPESDRGQKCACDTLRRGENVNVGAGAE